MNGAEADKWVESLEDLLEFTLKQQNSERASLFLGNLIERLRLSGVDLPPTVSTPYINTIPLEKEALFPGDWQVERKIKSYIRWNAMAMVVNANRKHSGLGGHISTYASCATLSKSPSIISFAAQRKRIAGISCIFRATPLPESMRARSSNGGWTNATSIIFARN